MKKDYLIEDSTLPASGDKQQDMSGHCLVDHAGIYTCHTLEEEKKMEKTRNLRSCLDLDQVLSEAENVVGNFKYGGID
jgi:hypothetical protein